MKTKELLSYNDTVTKLVKKGLLTVLEIKNLIESGSLRPLILDKKTGYYRRYRVIKINDDGTLDGEFEGKEDARD